MLYETSMWLLPNPQTAEMSTNTMSWMFYPINNTDFCEHVLILDLDGGNLFHRRGDSLLGMLWKDVWQYLYHVCMWAGYPWKVQWFTCTDGMRMWGRSFTLHVPLTCSFQASQDQPGHLEVVSYPLHSSKKRHQNALSRVCLWNNHQNQHFVIIPINHLVLYLRP